MAARKKRKTTRSVKKKAKRKAVRKAAPRKRTRKAAVKAKAGTKAKKKTVRRAAKREFGEGNYKASQRFRKGEEAFVKANRAKIPAMGKAAEDALAGPDGATLRAAEAEAAGHAAGQG